MWNYSVPYVLKQYIDTVIQPGINLNDMDNLAEAAIYRYIKDSSVDYCSTVRDLRTFVLFHIVCYRYMCS
jgi:putative NADPH-quinone reductase